MTILIIGLGVVCLALMVFLGLVICLNYSQNNLLKLLALLLGGLGLLLTTFVVPLKGDRKDYIVYDDIIIDKKNHLPASTMLLENKSWLKSIDKQEKGSWEERIKKNPPLITNNNYYRSLNTFHDLVIPTALKINENNIDEFYVELMIYKLINDLDQIHFTSSGFTQEFMEMDDNGVPKYNIKKIKIDISTSSYTNSLKKELSKMSYFKQINKASYLGNIPFNLPKLDILKITKKMNSNKQWQGVILMSKTGFFDIAFNIEKIRGSNNSNGLPTNLNTNKINTEFTKNLTARTYAIVISAEFEQLRSSSKEMMEYKKWFNYVVEQLDHMRSTKN